MTTAAIPIDQTTKPGRPPAHLDPVERAVWLRLQSEYGLTDAPAVVLLTVLCDALGVARRAREQIDAEGIAPNGRPHPLTKTLIDASKVALTSLRALNCDLEPLQASAGRPPGR